MTRILIKLPCKAFVVLALLFAIGASTVSAAVFSLSFLEDGAVLEDTCLLLKQAGVAEDAVSAFQKNVELHNKNGNRVNKTKFPVKEMGYYRFLGISDFTNRLACPFYVTPADSSLDQNTLMCFDVAGLLLRGAGCEAARFDQGFESKAIVLIGTDGTTKHVGYNTFRSENHLLYPETGYEYFVGRARSEAETRLGLSLRAARVLASGDLNRDYGSKTGFAEYVAALKQDGFDFPKCFKLGLGLFINPKGRYIVGDHAFICLSKDGRLICLEKNGPRGPFVRAEFQSEVDLSRYISWSLLQEANNPKEKEFGSTVLVSLNDRLIGIFHPANLR